LGALEPGQYLVRTAPKQLDEETGLLPTFYTDVSTVEQARSVEAGLDEQATDINVRPIFGKLCRIEGRVMKSTAEPVAIELVSDMGTTTSNTDAGGMFRFEHLAPGAYELIVDTTVYRQRWGAYQKISIEKDTKGIGVEVRPAPTLRIQFDVKEGRKIDPKAISVFAQRKDLSGVHEPRKISSERDTLLPGPWEIAVKPAPDLYPVSITGGGHTDLQSARADGWNEIFLAAGPPTLLRVVLSARPAALRGKVTGWANEPAIGAPVYLEAIDHQEQKRVTDLRSIRTDKRGEFQFNGLAPGHYRVLSTFEFEDPDEQTMQAARAKTISLKEGVETVQDLDLYVR
jgi:hypothetical protein